MLRIRCFLLCVLVLSIWPVAAAAVDPSPISPFIQPEECDITLPTEDEAIARLRAIGIPEQTPPGATPDFGPEEPYLPSIPAGTMVDDPELNQALVGTLRRYFACGYHDTQLSLMAFASDELLRRLIVSVSDLQTVLNSMTPEERRFNNQLALWETMGMRELGNDRYGLIAIWGQRFEVSSDGLWVDLAFFYIFVRQENQFFLDDLLYVGEVCEYGDAGFIPWIDPYFPDATPTTNDQVCNPPAIHR
jgi:hypothetical protein